MRAPLILLATLILSSSLRTSAQPHQTWIDTAQNPKHYGDTFDWAHGSPSAFLEMLQKAGSIYPVTGIHHDWIRDDDIEALMNLLDSPTPCAHVVQTSSSHLPSGNSTVGHEAAYLLEGYRHHYYPPALSSDQFKPNREALKQWFQIWKTRRP